MDLIHDHKIQGNENNFIGTVGMKDPFDPFKHGWCDSSVDEVVDGTWYKDTVCECVKIANGEHFLYLDWFVTVTELEQMFTNKILWSPFHSHSVFSIESVDTKQLHGIHLVNYLILIIYPLQATVYHVLDTKVIVGWYAIFTHVLKVFWSLHWQPRK